MSKRQYKRGKLIHTVAEFEACESVWYIVFYGSTNPKTTHRGFLTSWSYNTLANFIHRGQVYEAEKISDQKEKADES